MSTLNFKSWLSNKHWVVLSALILIITGMGYSLLWTAWILGKPSEGWVAPGDLWGIIRAAKYVTSGYFGYVYRGSNGVVTFPGLLLILTPVVWLSTKLGASFSTRLLLHPFPHINPRPDAWLLIGPYEMLIGSIPLFALDALAERLGISTTRRAILTFFEMGALWPLLVIWGHPEDAIAVGIGLYGLMAAMDARYVKAGWLFGAGIAIQPLVGLIFPIVFGLVDKKHWLSLAIRGALPSLGLLVVPLISSPRSTFRAVFEQPTPPLINHPTPWVYLAPKIRSSVSNPSNIKHAISVGNHLSQAVSGGPTRILAIVAAFTLGYWVYTKLPPLIWVVWLVGLSFAFRCFFESVMVPYYFWPAIALGLLAAARTGWIRFVSTFILAGALTVFSYWHFGPWVYWLFTTALLASLLGLSLPGSIALNSFIPEFQADLSLTQPPNQANS